MSTSHLSPKPAQLPGRGSIWQHFKGGLYRVVVCSRHSENPDQWLVTYEPADGEGDPWTRLLVLYPGTKWPGYLDVLFDKQGEPHRFRHVAGPRSWHDELTAEPSRFELLEILDNVSAAARNMLTQFGSQMKQEDAAWRRQTINAARTICDRELRGEGA